MGSENRGKRRVIVTVKLLATASFALMPGLLWPQQMIASVARDTLELNVGSTAGVRTDMTGRVVRSEMVAGILHEFEIAQFVVVKVRPDTSTATIVTIGEGWRLESGLEVEFDQPLRVVKTNTGVLIVRSNVSDDVASIDGRRLGPTPQRLNVKPGNYLIRVSKDGYESSERAVTVTDGEEVLVNLELRVIFEDPLELQRRGAVAFETGRWNEAIGFYEELLALVPNDPLAKVRLGEAREKMKIEQDVTHAASLEMVEEVRRNEEMSKKLPNADYLIQMGDDLAAEGNWQLAADYYQQVSEVDPSYQDSECRLHLALARLAAKNQDHKKALIELEHALSLELPKELAGIAKSLREVYPATVTARFTAAGRDHPYYSNISSSQNACAEKEGVPAVVKDATSESRWVLIPDGSFQMGCVQQDNDCNAEEKPQHAVEISRPFYMMTTEVSVSQFKTFALETGLQVRSPSFTQLPNHPVVGMTWKHANDYCHWLGGRLPTEAEWEFVARGPSGRGIYSWGDEFQRDLVNAGKSDCCGGETVGADRWIYTSPVDEFPPNGFGVFNLIGNVREYCNDWYSSSFYSNSPPVDPVGPSSGELKIVRGGSWASFTFFLRVSHRMTSDPQRPSDQTGFRCVADLPTFR